MAHQPGTRIIRTINLYCDTCQRTTDFPPGRLTEDGTGEIRQCDECGNETVDTTWYYARPSEADLPSDGFR
ncbi:MAG: hypothetical protein QM621_11845 [Aeromicrobium sp.]|uniref:hypothetical protein n=1 Tax=Aeromicrobium sp. TaxID=1871063 RepID=UPI0039E2391D